MPSPAIAGGEIRPSGPVAISGELLSGGLAVPSSGSALVSLAELFVVARALAVVLLRRDNELALFAPAEAEL